MRNWPPTHPFCSLIRHIRHYIRHIHIAGLGGVPHAAFGHSKLVVASLNLCCSSLSRGIDRMASFVYSSTDARVRFARRAKAYGQGLVAAKHYDLTILE